LVDSQSNDCSADFQAATGFKVISTTSNVYNLIHNQTFVMQERWSKNLQDSKELPFAAIEYLPVALAPRPGVLTAENKELSEKMLTRVRVYRCTSVKLYTRL
jgi:hypothetical protein